MAIFSERHYLDKHRRGHYYALPVSPGERGNVFPCGRYRRARLRAGDIEYRRRLDNTRSDIDDQPGDTADLLGTVGYAERYRQQRLHLGFSDEQ